MTVEERLEAMEVQLEVVERHVQVLAARLRQTMKVRDEHGRERGVLYWPELSALPIDPA